MISAKHQAVIVTLLLTLVIISKMSLKNVSLNRSKTNVLFIHHSTGGNLLYQGGVRHEIRKISSNIDFWDHNYNLSPLLPSLVAKVKFLHRTGLSDPDGNFTGIDYDINLNNNDPKDYEKIFTSVDEEETRNKILQFDVIIFKKCFPTSQVESEARLDRFKDSYLNIRSFIDSHPEKLFIIMTQPPLRSETTSWDNANRARSLSSWLHSPEFIGDRKNIRVFDLFSLLADKDGENQNRLRREYTPLFYRDSHPNKYANKTIAPIFASFIVNEINNFEEGT